MHRLPIEAANDRISFDWTPATTEPARRVSPHAVLALLVCLDLAGLVWLAAASIVEPGFPPPSSPQLWMLVAISGEACLLAAQWQRLYDIKTLSSSASWIVAALTGGFATCAAIFAVTSLSQTSAAAWPMALAVCGVGWVIGVRVALRAGLRRAARHGVCLQRAMVLAATPGTARMAISDIETASAGLTRVVGKALLAGVDSEAGFASLSDSLARNQVDQIVIADFEPGVGSDAHLVARLRAFAVDLLLLPNDRLRLPAPVQLVQFGHVTALGLSGRPLRTAQAILKTGFDQFLALLVLVLCAPLLAAIAVAVKLDSKGPVMFRQQRVGLNGAVFRMWKFRTMYVTMQDNTATNQTRRNDARVTRVGRLLRRTSLDELPQIINVLAGDMSIVGPRPHATGMVVEGAPVSDLVAGYAARHRVKPGITGWAQVNGSRGPVENERQLVRRVALDCHYIECWSFRLELSILMRTLFSSYMIPMRTDCGKPVSITWRTGKDCMQ